MAGLWTYPTLMLSNCWNLVIEMWQNVILHDVDCLYKGINAKVLSGNISEVAVSVTNKDA